MMVLPVIQEWIFVTFFSADPIINVVDYRKYDDQAKVISYINIFSESFLSFQLLEWITHQTGMEGKIFSSDVSNPVAFISEFLWYLYVFNCR